MKKTVALAAVIVVVICTAIAWSQGGPGPVGPPPGGPGGPRGMGGPMACPVMAVVPPHGPLFDRLATDLQLTEAQIVDLRKAEMAGQEKIRAAGQKAGEASRALREAILAADFNVDNIRNLAAAAQKAEAALIAANIDQWVQIKSILTADQFARLQEIMQKPGPGPRPGGPPPPGAPVPPPPPGQ